jgi:hypothetical protein
MKNYIETLKKYGKKTILKADLEDLFAVSSDESLFEIVSFLCEEQILSPIKGSKTNGNRLYPIHLKYKVSVPQESYEAELKEIDALHPLLLHNGYARFADFVLENGAKRVAIEIDDQASHDPRHISVDKFCDDLL